jgi:hypothetical protein
VGGKTSELLVWRSLCDLAALTVAWEVFTFPLVPVNQVHGSPSHEIRPPSEFCRTALPPHLMMRLPLLGFPSHLAPSALEVHLPTELCLLRSVPSPGFLNLLTACSSHCLAALFHAAGTRWVLLSERFPFQEPFRLSTDFCPLVVPRPAPLFRKIATAGRGRLQGLAPLESPLPAVRGLGSRQPAALVGFRPSRVTHSARRKRCFHLLPLLSLTARR